NPEIRESERANWTEPEWANCLHLRLEMPLEPETDSEDPAILHIELLRPESWVRDRLAVVADAGQTDTPVSDTPRAAALDGGDEPTSAGTTGEAIASVPLSPLRPIFRDIALASAALSAEGAELIGLTLEMDLPEMGVSGTAVVTDLRSCPTVKRGDGQVVTATFAHPPSRQVLDVAFEGESEPIGVTGNHLFWSVDREQFQAIGEMELGERVQTYHGDTKRIVSKLPRPGPQTVYNLEVYGEHVYFVGQQGLLAHNAYSAPNSAASFTNAINPRLTARLDVFRSYRANGGTMNMGRWVKATQGNRYYGTGFQSGFADWSRRVGRPVHGNSLAAQGAHDVYVLRDAASDRLLHFGETGRGYLTRFAEHQREYALLGIDIEVDLLRTVEGKAAARALETTYIDTFRRIFGQRPSNNPVNH
ncbi:MAG: Hint domain-containing protein, partial [Candidatus Paceibacterota bacterium]